MNETTIVVCWQPGTEDMVNVCLSSIARHTRKDQYQLMLVSTSESMPLTLPMVSGLNLGPTKCINFPPPSGKESSKLHGWMLDQVIPERIETPYLLTLDSDCFPVADGWLEELIAKVEGGATIAGILHPWAPPPAELPKNKLEYRVRSQHCWDITHVACQLLRTEDYLELHDKGCRYNGGDDTGLLIPKMVREKGGTIDGFKPTRCPIAWEGDFDPEYNRYSCIVFGDKVYHHGGFSRGRILNDDANFARSFGWFEEVLLWGKGAELLLKDRYSYQFKFDKEEEVSKEKMQRIFGLKSQRMLG